MDDSARSYKTAEISRTLAGDDTECMAYLAYSPDIYPIEFGISSIDVLLKDRISSDRA